MPLMIESPISKVELFLFTRLGVACGAGGVACGAGDCWGTDGSFSAFFLGTGPPRETCCRRSRNSACCSCIKVDRVAFSVFIVVMSAFSDIVLVIRVLTVFAMSLQELHIQKGGRAVGLIPIQVRWNES